MPKSVIWVHGDNLNPNAETFQQFQNTPAIFVFDDELLFKWGISLKRITFMYECLLELPVSIRKGNVTKEIFEFYNQHQASQIVTMFSPSPRFSEMLISLQEQIGEESINVLYEQPMIISDETFELRRFSKFWRKAKPYAIKNK